MDSGVGINNFKTKYYFQNLLSFHMLIDQSYVILKCFSKSQGI